MGKQVKTPRFYVDMPTFLHATGDLGWDDENGGAELLYMNCANPLNRLDELEDTNEGGLLFEIGDREKTPKTAFPINFCALLNHNLGSDSNGFLFKGFKDIDAVNGINFANSWVNPVNIINTNFTINNEHNILDSEYNGTTIWRFDELNFYWRGFRISCPTGFDDYTHQLGSFVIGKYWDAPNSPDLNLTMSRRFDGIKKQKTIGGKTLANIYYDGPTEWTINHRIDGTYKYPPFELDSIESANDEIKMAVRAKSGLGRKGLRSWKLTFSYISEDDMWMSYENSSLAPFSEPAINVGDTHSVTGDSVIPSDDSETVADYFEPNPMLSDDSFNFVWNCTLGGTLPFIFQPDNTNNNPDQFAICTFRENTLSVQQVAFNTYKVSMTIDELA